MNTSEASCLIKAEALRLGFSACGICEPGFVGDQAIYLQKWLEKGFHGRMAYMERNVEKRCNPLLLVENAHSVVVVAMNYYPERKQQSDAALVSYYAYGKDYHLVVKERLQQLYAYIHREIAPVNGRVFCDTAPLLEKYHAVKAGLGWIGKNTQLIIPGKGSFFFLGELVLDIPLAYDEAFAVNRCGGCTKCIDACPTKALTAPGELNANRCLSYLSIEYAGELPEFYAKAAGHRVYGCDTCNQVCPWNSDAVPTIVPEFSSSEALLALSPETIDVLDEAGFDTLFSHSPIHRIGLGRLKRNLAHINT